MKYVDCVNIVHRTAIKLCAPLVAWQRPVQRMEAMGKLTNQNARLTFSYFISFMQFASREKKQILSTLLLMVTLHLTSYIFFSPSVNSIYSRAGIRTHNKQA